MESNQKIKHLGIRWQYIVLAAIIVLSFFLNFWNLAKEGYSNEYYSAAVASMLKNPAAFFFGSLDTGLYVTVDKPPVGLWLQALSVHIFGQNALGFIFPSALAGVLCVLMVFLIVKKIWGLTPGILASGVMAAMPILVAMSRTNNMDMLLLFFLLLASLAMLRAVKRQSLPWYILAMAIVGVAFNVKMLEAFFVVPAFILIYLVAGKGKPVKKLIHTAVAVCVLAAVSFSWALVVDAIPTGERPYIGSSQKNSVMNLVFGYNGIARLTGERGIGGSGELGGLQSPGNQDGGGFQDSGNEEGAQNAPPNGGNPQ
jgi:4-amino-4-deoxy-L-arabinose transferase-like glycosyltransferase